MACVMDWNINKKKGKIKKEKKQKFHLKWFSGCDFRGMILLILTSLKLIFNIFISVKSEGTILNFCRGFLLRFIILIYSVNCYFIILPGEVCYKV